MSGTIHYMEQRSDDWFQHRIGRVTASRIADIMAKTKTGPSALRSNYAAEIVAERLTGEQGGSGFSNAAMQWGTEQEPFARMAYEFSRDAEVIEVGFIDHPHIDMAGCSPDGLVGDTGMVEIKAPNTATHLRTLDTEKIEGKYLKQIQFQLACSGRSWCDFVSFDPRLPGNMQLYVQRVERDTGMIKEIEAEVQSFLREVELTVERMRAKFGDEAA